MKTPLERNKPRTSQNISRNSPYQLMESGIWNAADSFHIIEKQPVRTGAGVGIFYNPSFGAQKQNFEPVGNLHYCPECKTRIAELSTNTKPPSLNIKQTTQVNGQGLAKR